MEVQQVRSQAARPLIAVAEGIEAERQATRRLRDAKTEQLLVLFENLIMVSGANVYAAAVLRWLVEHGALDDGAELDAQVIARDPWVRSSEKTVRRAIQFWESIHCRLGPVFLAHDQIDKAGRLTSRLGQLRVEAVKEFLSPTDADSQSDPRTNRPMHGLIDRPSDSQSDPRTNSPSLHTPTVNRREEISEAQFEERKRLAIESLQRSEQSAQDMLLVRHDHGHDTIDIEAKRAPYHSTIVMNHGHGERQRPDSSPGPAAAVGAALATLIDRFADPKEQKRRLVARIQAVVGDAKMNPVIPRIAADLVVFHAVPMADLEHILVDVESLREARTLRKPGAFFLDKARKLAAQHGKPWPESKTSAVADTVETSDDEFFS